MERVYDKDCSRIMFFAAEPGSLGSHNSGRPGRSEARRERPSAGGGVAGRGRNAFHQAAPQARSYRPKRGSWLRQYCGRWVRGGPALQPLGNPTGAHFRMDHWRAAFPAWPRSSVPRVPLRDAEADGAPWKGVPVFLTGGRVGETRVGCGGYLMRGSLDREVGSGEHGGGL